MLFGLVSGALFLLLSNTKKVNGVCNGCTGECHEFSNVGNGEDVFACKCEFGGGVQAGEQFCCGNGYHVCKSANEMYNYGLRTEICSNTIPNGEAYFSLESGNGNTNCFSENGISGTNDVWGCTGDDSIFPGCFATTCGKSTNIGCTKAANNDVFEFPNSNHYDEVLRLQVKDSNKGGLLCCRDPTPAPTPAPTPYPTPQPTREPTAAPIPAPTSTPTQVPTERKECEKGCKDGIEYCENGCNSHHNELCEEHNEENGLCESCINGYFMKNKHYPCVSCKDTIEGCLECSDYLGCIKCDECNDYKIYFDKECGISRCKLSIFQDMGFAY